MKAVLKLGKGTLLAKLDLQSAYRNVPIHPDDRALLGMRWQGEVFVDKALPFGLRSNPKIFNAVADGLLWIMAQQGVQVALHYLDDYLFLGKPEANDCTNYLRIALDTCSRLGVTVLAHKVEGPSTVLTFLGILLDTEKMEIRLPQDKLQRLVHLLYVWSNKKACTKRELLSLIGQLQHASRVVPHGRSFL